MKKTYKYFVATFFFIAFLAPLAFSYAYNFTQPLKPFSSSGEDVNQLQFILSKEGFFKANVNGNYGTLTVEAVRKYQAKHRLTPDGSVGPKTLAVLNGQVLGVTTSKTSTTEEKEGGASCNEEVSVSQYVSLGMVHKDVATVQERLDCFGFTDGPNDGIYGKQTMASVAAFQKSLGIVGDGTVVGKETLAALKIIIVSRTTVLPEFTVKRSFGTPGPTTVAPGTTDIHFADYELSTNAYTNTGNITLTSFTVILRQRTPASPAIVKNLKLFICPVSTAVCTTQVGATIPNPYVTNGPFSLNTFNVNVPFSAFEVKKATLRFDVDSSAVDGTMIDTEPGSGIFASVTPITTTVVHTPPLEASVVTVRRPNNLISLSLTKDVGYENGGSASPTSFQLILSGPTPVTGTTPVFANVQPGVYLFTENGPTGYTMSWTCSGGTVNGNQLTIPSNSTGVNCNIYNDDIPPRITLNKIVAPGAPDPESAWTISATKISGGQPGVGYSMTGPGAVGNADVVSNHLAQAGRYRLVESGPTTNYTNNGWSCSNGIQATQTGPYTAEFTIDINESTTCTITNTYSQPPQPPTLSLRKVIANGGPAVITNWNLIADPVTVGQPTVQGLGGFGVTTVSPGVYALSEAGSGPNIANYTQGTYSCIKNNGSPIVSNSITLSNGDNAVCTITNTYVPPPATIELRKTISGGSATLANFTPRIDGVDKTWNTQIVVTPGVTHVATEVMNVPNYTAGTWGGDCRRTLFNPTGGSFSVQPGDHKICTLKNTYKAPPTTLTLVKQVSGGTASPYLWTLKATPTPAIWGQSAISGIMGSTAVTNRSVAPGTYLLTETGGRSNYNKGTYSCIKNGQTTPTIGDLVTLALGDRATCTIINTYVPPVVGPCTINTFINPTNVSITANTNIVSVPVSWSTSNCTNVNVEIINGSGTKNAAGIWQTILGGSSGSHTFTWTVDSRYSGDNTIDVSIVAASNARGEIVSRVNTIQIANVTPYGNQCIFTNATSTPNITNSTTTLSWSAPVGCKVSLDGWTPDFLIHNLTNPNPLPGNGPYIFPSTGSYTYTLPRSMTFRFHGEIQNTPGGIPFLSNSQKFFDVKKQ